MENKFFMHRIKLANGVFDKGIEVKDTLDAAKQSYHAYLGAYAYGKDADTDFVSCMITDLLSGNLVLEEESWVRAEQPEE